MKKQILGVALAVALTGSGLSAPALAVENPVGSLADYRIRHVAYNDQDVVRLDAVIGIATHIIVGADEEYVTHAFGDPQGWEFAHKENHYFVKAKAQNSDTNLVIVTTKHSYNLVLHFIGNYPTRDSVGKVVKHEIGSPWTLRDATLQVAFSYPREEARAAAEQRAKDRANALFNGRGGANNLNYTMSATERDKEIAPVNVWDDGRFTYFKFPPNVDLPDIYTVSTGGSEAIVNRHMLAENGSRVIVAEKVAPKFRLRLGDDVVGVYNERFDPAGIQNVTGTSTPAVHRVIKGGE
ncbi:Forms the bulk of type IV secretion complex that spans outer membrane and periplasm (VirB9) [Candidatus Burkholderia verschuerenii]|uniref:Forms the bulk of type IV secretion complex that spans outer membrane and periplasm (VirB9) n=1 Tax=Candidatus Burkholderia verschuerenii TaxID=242163 RepID=A0A0L0MF65_9BURK|nr:TrbG/VirB9 family P-type conjugative transfer protein [Candidatus Burkholderia verschuerenii]KND60584.1 Forms the bulk of type IV secretion complex that spans outer membrane and periplasm (VirB9) [Candidatus Burkholderia verschuerenii]